MDDWKFRTFKRQDDANDKISGMEQLCLFEPNPQLQKLDHLQKQRAVFSQHIRTHNTMLTFRYSWKTFVTWCEQQGYVSLPATNDTVALYVTALLDLGRRISSAKIHLNAITYMHRAAAQVPPSHEEAQKILAGAQRLRKETPRGRIALSAGELQRICRKFDPGCPRDVRDHALLVFGFASGLRRSTLAALDLEDITFTSQGILVAIRHEKTDQEGRGRSIGLSPGKHPETCPVRTLQDWLNVRGTVPGGPLFRPVLHSGHSAYIADTRISSVAVLLAVKRAVARIGLDPDRYGAHSLRAGMITAALEAGASEAVISKHSGHRSIQALRQYYRPRTAFASNIGQFLGI